MKKRTYGTGSYRKLPSGNYQLRYNDQTKVIEASTDKQAERKLRDWVDEKDEEAKRGPKLSMSQILDLYLLDHRKHNRVETAQVETKIEKVIRPRIGHLDAQTFGTEEVDLYVDSRRKDVHPRTKKPPANGTINRELSIISHGLRLAAPKLQRIVFFGKSFLQESKPRQGITSEELYHAMLLELPDYIKPLWCYAYYTGVRSGQLKKFRWEWMDWDEWVVRCPGVFGDERITKNGEPHPVPVFWEMREFTKHIWETRNPACPYMFQRNGQRIKSFRKAFENARARVRLAQLLPDSLRTRIRDLREAQLRAFDWVPDVEVAGLFQRTVVEKWTDKQILAAIQERPSKPVSFVLFHDQRRTAVTNLIRNGVAEKDAMAVSGHLDRSMLDRYTIVKEQDVKRAAAHMTERLREKREQRAREAAMAAEKNSGINFGTDHSNSEPWRGSTTLAKLKQ